MKLNISTDSSPSYLSSRSSTMISNSTLSPTALPAFAAPLPLRSSAASAVPPNLHISSVRSVPCATASSRSSWAPNPLPPPPLPPPAWQSSAPKPAEPAPLPLDAVPYFAYFSNLNPRRIGPISTIKSRRFPLLRSVNAVLSDYTLSLTVPGIPPEPVFATIEPSPNASIHGVVHWLSENDFTSLARSEGVYTRLAQSRLIDLQVTLSDGTVIAARTFVFDNRVPQLPGFRFRPSRRYVEIAREGARYWKLDRRYIRGVLDRIEVDNSPLSAFGMYVEPRPHPLDRPDPLAQFGNETTELFSPYQRIMAEKAFNAMDDNTTTSNDLHLVQLTSNRPNARPLYFVPGIDGTGKSILSQVHDIEEEAIYDMKSAVYPPGNRDSLEKIAASLLVLIHKDAAGRAVSIVAESMGGVIAILAILENIRRKSTDENLPTIDIDLLLMLNPATSYERSDPRALFEFLLSLNIPDSWYPTIAPAVLMPFLLDVSSTRQALNPEGAPRLVRMLRSIGKFGDAVPQASIKHRLKLLSSTKISDDMLARLAGPHGPSDIGLIVATNDQLIPSLSESYRMRRVLPNMYSIVLPFGGHIPMFDKRFSLAGFLRPFVHGPRPRATLLKTEIVSEPTRRKAAALRKKFGTGEAIPPKSREDLRRLRDFLSKSQQDFSPVFIGEENLDGLSRDRPVLFLCNHTLLGWLDGGFLILRMITRYGVELQSLAHPALFSRPGMRFPGTTNATKEDMQAFGITPVSPTSALRLLTKDRWVLLFPGGVREALLKDENTKYQVMWPEDPEFVRMCGMLGVTIVPVSTVGAEDSLRIVAGQDMTRKILETGARLTGQEFDEEMFRDVSRAWKKRDGANGADALVLPPVMLPNGKDRIYFRFGKPIVVGEDVVRDNNAERRMYEQVRKSVEEGVDILLRRRKSDEMRGVEKRKEFRDQFGDGVEPPAGPGWAWVRGEDSYLDEECQPPL